MKLFTVPEPRSISALRARHSGFRSADPSEAVLVTPPFRSKPKLTVLKAVMGEFLSSTLAEIHDWKQRWPIDFVRVSTVATVLTTQHSLSVILRLIVSWIGNSGQHFSGVHSVLQPVKTRCAEKHERMTMRIPIACVPLLGRTTCCLLLAACTTSQRSSART